MTILFCVAGYAFFIGVSVGHLIFLVNYTEMVLEYGKLLRLTKVLSLGEYEQWKNLADNESYGFPVFFREKYRNFLGRLVGCHYCLITFICILVTGPLGFVSAAIGSVLYGIELFLHKKNKA